MDSFSFFQQLELSKDGTDYIELIRKVQQKGRGLAREQGYEIHHIHPQSLGGSKDSQNLIKLTIREHIEAHYLLALIFGGNMYYAFQMLTSRAVKHLTDVDKKDLDRWALLREKALTLPRPPVSEETREKIAAAHRGTIQSKESNQKRSQTLKGRVSPNKGNRLPEAVRSKIREIQKEVHARPEYRKKLKIAQNDPELKKRRSEQMRGRIVSEETKHKISNASKGRKQSFETRIKRSKALLGNICVFKEGKGKRIRPEELQQYLDTGYFRTRKESFL